MWIDFVIVIMSILFVISFYHYTRVSKTEEYKQAEKDLEQAIKKLEAAVVETFKFDEFEEKLNRFIKRLAALKRRFFNTKK